MPYRVQMASRQTIKGSADWTAEPDSAELVLSMNLFKGGADRAALAEAQQKISQAAYERERACNNMRQMVSVAYNDMLSLAESLVFLKDHRLAMEKARGAYRDQFNVGQRTLLDLLDAENEYYESRRAYRNARHDYALAHARILAATGRLLQALELQRTDMPAASDLRFGTEQTDPLTFCPPIDPAASFSVIDAAQASSRAAYAAGKHTYPGGSDTAMMECNSAESSAHITCSESNELIFSTNSISFGYNSTAIQPGYESALAEIADLVNRHSPVPLIIEGHTDNIGSYIYNLRLSQARANAVRDLLITEFGVDPLQIRAIGRGYQQPIADNDSEEGRAVNRRVELVMPTNWCL